jgi:hypothetical protein
VTQTKGATGGWLDFWVICDDANCHLFFSDDNGHFYRAKTAVADFPSGFGEPVVVLRDDANPTNLYEAANVYKVKGSASTSPSSKASTQAPATIVTSGRGQRMRWTAPGHRLPTRSRCRSRRAPT